MNQEIHNALARKALAALVDHISNPKTGIDFITYKKLAEKIDYPVNPIGSHFGRQIGNTLAVMGHMIEDVEVEGQSPPHIQAVVVNITYGVPSNGFSEFYPDYPNLTNPKKRDFAKAELAKVKAFGTRWYTVLDRLDIPHQTFGPATNGSTKPKRLYNPFGGEGSPEHRALRDYVRDHPHLVGLAETEDLQAFVEYPLKSGDKVDVLFETVDQIVAVEVKSNRSGESDLERGLFQCVKYQAVLEAEAKAQWGKRPSSIQTILALETDLPDNLKRVQKKLNITVLENVQPTENTL